MLMALVFGLLATPAFAQQANMDVLLSGYSMPIDVLPGGQVTARSEWWSYANENGAKIYTRNTNGDFQQNKFIYGENGKFRTFVSSSTLDIVVARFNSDEKLTSYTNCSSDNGCYSLNSKFCQGMEAELGSMDQVRDLSNQCSQLGTKFAALTADAGTDALTKSNLSIFNETATRAARTAAQRVPQKIQLTNNALRAVFSAAYYCREIKRAVPWAASTSAAPAVLPVGPPPVTR